VEIWEILPAMPSKFDTGSIIIIKKSFIIKDFINKSFLLFYVLLLFYVVVVVIKYPHLFSETSYISYNPPKDEWKALQLIGNCIL